jgi:LysR family transcriptional regulator, hydrogen peroxide-inducible genes activator
MEMHQIRYFLAVADELNFTRAAERCNVSQPSLTRAIKLLEGELGGLLFHRERVNTHLSELGRMVLPHLMQVHEETQTAKRRAIDFTKRRRWTLKLGIMCTIAPDQIIDLIGSIQAHHPGIELALSDANAVELQQRLIEGDLEVAIYCLPTQHADDHLHVVPLFREKIVAAISPKHRLANQATICVGDLHGEPYIHRMDCEFAGYADSVFAAQKVTCTAVYWSDRDDWTLAMVAAGLGWAFMPANSVKHPGVLAVPLVEPEFWRAVNLVTVRGRPYSPGVGALVREAMRVKWFGESALGQRPPGDTLLPSKWAWIVGDPTGPRIDHVELAKPNLVK